MSSEVLESDWKVYRKSLEGWRERYLAKQNEKLIKIVINTEHTPTEQFWNAKGFVDEQAKILQDCLDHHSRSNMFMSLLLMLRYELINESDLNEFSEDLRSRLVQLVNS